jgi:hypothetical protein
MAGVGRAGGSLGNCTRALRFGTENSCEDCRTVKDIRLEFLPPTDDRRPGR